MLTLVLLLFMCINTISCKIVNLSVKREVDLTTPIAKLHTKIVLNDDSENRYCNYSYYVHPDVQTFHIRFSNNIEKTLQHEQKNVTVNGRIHQVLFVYIPKTQKIDEEVELNIDEAHTNSIRPLRKKKLMGEFEPVVYQGDVYYYSKYNTMKSKITYRFANEFVANVKPSQSVSLKAVYSFNGIIKPFTDKQVKFNFVSSDEFLHVLNLNRTIDISHYGQIKVEEEIKIKNMGASVYGPYKETEKKYLYTHLPASAENIVLYDVLGLIYSFQIVHFKTYKTLKFMPRCKLLGGWQIEYNIQYSVPTYQYLRYTDTNVFELEMNVVDHVLNNAVIDYFETRVILPENAIDAYSYIPTTFKRLGHEYLVRPLTYYDRKAIIISGENILEDHYKNFKVRYAWNHLNLFAVPLKLSLFCYSIFLFIIFSKRLSKFFTIQC